MPMRPMFLIGLAMCCGLARGGVGALDPRDLDPGEPGPYRIAPQPPSQLPATQPSAPSWQFRFPDSPYGDPFFAPPRVLPYDPYRSSARPSTQPKDSLSREHHFQFNGRPVYIVPLRPTTQPARNVKSPI